MMQPSLPPSPKTASSIYEAIRDCDWEGLLALYATTVYDAVHSEDFAHQQINQDSLHHRQHSSSPSLMTGIVKGRNRSGSFHEETKSGEVHLKNYKSSPLSSSSSAVHELDLIVREIIGAEIFDEHRAASMDDQKQVQSNNFKKQADGQPNNKKTRQHSPARGESTNLRCLPSVLDQILSHKSSSTSSSNKIPDWEKIMWNSASSLSNTAPSPSFVASRQDRNRHQSRYDNTKNEIKGEDKKDNNSTIFEGSVAIATPGDLADGGTGSGTAQHLACLLDSPFALCILIVLGIHVDSRYTTFRRLAIHEAAASDSPRCLQLLMELGTRFSKELLSGDTESVSPMAYLNTTTAALSSGGIEISSATMTTSQQQRSSTSGKKKKKKLNNIFNGKWHKGKSLEGSGDSTLKNFFADDCKASNNNKASSFPIVALTLKVLWDATQKLGSGEIKNEIEASHYVFDRVKVTDRAMLILASSQYSHHIPENIPQSEDKVAAVDLRSLIMKSNVDGNGNTPLHWAAFKGSVRAMKVLLSFNVDVNARAQSGWTPLHDAAYSDSGDIVALLIAAGATVNARCLSGATALCFAAQEDSANSTGILLRAGADPSLRCLGNNPGRRVRANNADNNRFHSRFSGYTPLHYCAHYNASKAARVLLTESSRSVKAADLLRIPDVNGKISIHVAVARGSCLVLKELLHGGARIKTSSRHSPPSSPRAMVLAAQLSLPLTSPSVAIPTATDRDDTANEDANALSTSPIITTPVSSPVLRAMIPRTPVTSSKKWNCLTQRAIDDCKNLINQADMNWTPERHSLFSPTDRNAIVEVLRVGKRLESVGRGMFIDLWPHVLAFCGRGWFEAEEETGATEMDRKIPAKKGHEEEISDDSSDESSPSDEDDDDFTQFQLDGIHTAIV